MGNVDRAANDSRFIDEARHSPAAFVHLYRRHYDAIFRYCAHRLFDRHRAEDVTSQVFLKAVENFGRFNGGEAQFRNWLYTIATNAVNDHLRKTERRRALLRAACERADSGQANCEDTPDERLAALREAVLSLRPRCQTIIALRFFENLKLTEVADVLGSSSGTIRSQLARALAKLRKVLPTEFTD